MKLIERKQVGTLYHFTYLDNLVNIVKTNELRSGSKEPYKQKHTNYISFTRSRNFENEIGFEAECRLVIDGDKLSDKYHIEPFNYYSGNQNFGTYSPKDFEKEERVWLANTDKINNISAYINRIDIIETAKDIKSYVETLKHLTNIPIKIIKSW